MSKHVSPEESNQLKIMIGFLECFGVRRDHIYLSTPITSGLRLYDVLEKYDVKDKGKLPKGVYFSEVILSNIEHAQKTAVKLRKKVKKLINPAEFDAMKTILEMEPRWGQEVYMGLWHMTIIRYADQIIFNEGWEYSQGCIQEWVICQEKRKHQGMDIPLDVYGNLLTPRYSCNKIELAVESIVRKGFNPSSLEYLLKRVRKY